ncbi:MAG: aldo/keto reductase [Pseudonocardiales bacterium]|nr:aldo/keto reductase [Pseudonocardiales bacterium]
MDHRWIGSLSVSVVGLGCNQLGTPRCDREQSQKVVDAALAAGITFFDTADVYGGNYADPTDLTGWGASEQALCAALRNRRDQVVIATKFGAVPPYAGTGEGGNGRRWVREALEGSLRRLDTDYVDLFQIHFPDPQTPIDETLDALRELVQVGKVREIGCTNFAGTAFADIAARARDHGMELASAQSQLNLLQQAALDDVLPECEKLDIAFLPYYPLARGLLTGRYRRHQPSGGSSDRVGRLNELGDEARDRLLTAETFDRLDGLSEFATERGHSLLELAFGWLLVHPTVATVIAGASQPAQVVANVKAATWAMSESDVGIATTLAAVPT